MIFGPKFAQNWYFRFKTEKSHFCVRPWSLLTILSFSAREPIDTVPGQLATRKNKNWIKWRLNFQWCYIMLSFYNKHQFCFNIEVFYFFMVYFSSLLFQLPNFVSQIEIAFCCDIVLQVNSSTLDDLCFHQTKSFLFLKLSFSLPKYLLKFCFTSSLMIPYFSMSRFFKQKRSQPLQQIHKLLKLKFFKIWN